VEEEEGGPSVDLVKSVLRLYSVVRARSRGFDL